MLHTEDAITCPVLPDPTDYHFERRCEDCDAQNLSRLSLAQVTDLYHQGRATQDEYEAYYYAWTLASPYRLGTPELPEIPAVARIAKKILHFHAERTQR